MVDGDTVDLAIDLGFYLLKQERIRVADIDAPESRTRDLAEKKLGLEAKDFVQQQLETAAEIIIRTEKIDKYGRYLGWLYLDGAEISLNEQMIHDGYAWSYDGGRKTKNLGELEQRRRALGTWREGS
ncbi:thermonuclease family protein [[Limnothrix rosea] IAM M-220]|uniref:thermonuclease family protein n=1 Tax=[Limnothrix rosea] IAM M-220 TaxID=454133 RepID=UPI001CEC2F51|nr:thermonuclease family protein [[Limnothrix rosea] IAM M-220]